jgi:hypothetical protein
MRNALCLRALFLSAALISLSDCRTGRPDFTINVPANVLNVRPPRTVLFLETPLRLAPLEQALDQAVARALPSGGGGTRLGMLDARWRLSRQPVQLVAAAPGLVVRVPITGDVSVGAGFLRCQASGIGGVFTIGIKPTLETGGGLVLREPRVSVQQVGALSCAGVQVPINDLFSFMLKPIEQALAAALGVVKIPLGPAIERGLAELSVPRAMDLQGRRACLDLDPQGLVVAPIGGGGQAAIRLGLDVAPRLALGECPQKPAAAPQSLAVREEASAGPSRVQVAVAIPSADLQAPLTAAIVGKRYGSGKNAVTVNGLQLGDASGQAMVRLDVSGAYNGQLYLWGTPQVSSENGRFILGVPDLRVAAESTSRLEELKLNLYQLFDGDLASKLRPHLRSDITDKLTQVQKQLTGNLEVNRSMWQQQMGGAAGILGLQSMSLSSQLQEVRPLGVESRPGLLVAYLELVGTLRGDVR